MKLIADLTSTFGWRRGVYQEPVMKFIPSKRHPDAPAAPKADRRGLVVGAGVAGVAGAAAALLHRGGVQAAAPAERAKAAPATNPGYQVTPHVQRYYETAKG